VIADGQQHTVAPSPASMTALLALARSDAILLWDPEDRTAHRRQRRRHVAGPDRTHSGRPHDSRPVTLGEDDDQGQSR
jgi:hypothetical protein